MPQCRRLRGCKLTRAKHRKRWRGYVFMEGPRCRCLVTKKKPGRRQAFLEQSKCGPAERERISGGHALAAVRDLFTSFHAKSFLKPGDSSATSLFFRTCWQPLVHRLYSCSLFSLLIFFSRSRKSSICLSRTV